MSMTEQERAAELERLERVLEEAREQLAETRETADKHKSHVGATRRMMWEEGKRTVTNFDDMVDLFQQEKLVGEQTRTHALYDTEVHRLEKLTSSPYFGRIDFRDNYFRDAQSRDADAERIYVGLSSLVERSTGEHLVYDWRAPISSLFYDAEPGPAGYDCAAGRVTGEVTLKRQYKVVDGRLRYLFDTNVTIEDELLQEILSKNADAQMQNIVTTIQREQNRIIRDETHPLLVVQGPAGSGKTSVALHRIAFLLYRFREELSAHDIIVISPSDIFSEYIAGVLPGLGEQNMLQTTFQAYATSRLGEIFELESMPEQMEYVLAGRGQPDFEARQQGIGLKSSLQFFQLLKHYVERIEAGFGIAFADAVHEGEVVASADELRRHFFDNAFLPTSQRLEKLKNRVAYLVEPQVKALREEIEAELRIRPEYSSKAEIRWEARTRVQAVFAPLHEGVARWASIDPIERYAELFRNEELFTELSGEAGLPEGFAAVREHTLDRLGKGELGYEDIAPLLFLQNALEGAPKKSGIRHVVVDEAQDYSPCHYAVLRQVFPHARFTILGDLNQSIHPYMHVDRYEDMMGVFDIPHAALLQLHKSYRSTQEIVAFTKALVPEGEPIEATLRSGPRPRLVQVKDDESRNEVLSRDVAALQAEGMRSIALICKTESEAARVYEQVGKALGGHRVTAGGADPASGASGDALSDASSDASIGVVVIPAYFAKGLEFDAVLIVDAGAAAYGHEDERKILYTACTRALHRLHLYVMGDLSPLMADVDPELYET